MTRLFFNADRSFFLCSSLPFLCCEGQIGGWGAGGGGRGARAIELALFLRVK